MRLLWTARFAERLRSRKPSECARLRMLSHPFNRSFACAGSPTFPIRHSIPKDRKKAEPARDRTTGTTSISGNPFSWITNSLPTWPFAPTTASRFKVIPGFHGTQSLSVRQSVAHSPGLGRAPTALPARLGMTSIPRNMLDELWSPHEQRRGRG